MHGAPEPTLDPREVGKPVLGSQALTPEARGSRWGGDTSRPLALSRACVRPCHKGIVPPLLSDALSILSRAFLHGISSSL